MGSTWPRVGSAVLIALSLAGCPSSSEPAADGAPPCWTEPEPDAPRGEVELGLGGGGGGFVPVAEGDPVELVSGPQGGHHFTLRARTQGMLPGEDRSTATLFTALTEDGEEIDILACPYQEPYDPSEGDDEFLVLRDDIFLIIDEEYVPSIAGRSLRFRVEVMDADGRYASDERTLIAQDEIDENAE